LGAPGIEKIGVVDVEDRGKAIVEIRAIQGMPLHLQHDEIGFFQAEDSAALDQFALRGDDRRAPAEGSQLCRHVESAEERRAAFGRHLRGEKYRARPGGGLRQSLEMSEDFSVSVSGEAKEGDVTHLP
jgi:hypothetical protein